MTPSQRAMARLKTELQALPRRARCRMGQPTAQERVELRSAAGYPLAVTFTRPRAPGPWPAVLLCPGSEHGADSFEGWGGPLNTRELAARGLVVASFDPAGRGRSWGPEDYGGDEHQDNVRVVFAALRARPEVRPERVGVVAISLGLAMACGALARWPAELPAAFLLDWEGPHDRRFITAEGARMAPALGHRLDDDFYWHPREAVRHVGALRCPYVRVQADPDHAQPGPNRHALDMLQAAAAAGLDSFRLNEHPPGVVPEAPRWYAGGRRAANRALLLWIERLTQ